MKRRRNKKDLPAGVVRRAEFLAPGEMVHLVPGKVMYLNDRRELELYMGRRAAKIRDRLIIDALLTGGG